MADDPFDHSSRPLWGHTSDVLQNTSMVKTHSSTSGYGATGRYDISSQEGPIALGWQGRREATEEIPDLYVWVSEGMGS